MKANRTRMIESILCGKFLLNRYQKLPDEMRFSMLIAFEGEYKDGTRHAHILVFVPKPMKRCKSHSMLLTLFPQEFRFLWARLGGLASRQVCHSSRTFAGKPNDKSGLPLDETALHFERRAITIQAIYCIKRVRLRDVPWSHFEFVTPPRSKTFKNENLSVIHNGNRQRRQLLGLQ